MAYIRIGPTQRPRIAIKGNYNGNPVAARLLQALVEQGIVDNDASTNVPSDRYGVDVLTTSGLVSYWRMNEPSGSNANDIFGGHGGTWTATPTFNVAGIPGANGSTGVTITGTQWVNVNDSAFLHLTDGPLTLEAWVKRSATQSAIQAIISKFTGAYLMRFNAANNLEFLSSGTASIVTSTSTLTDTASWHHLVSTKTAGTLHLYIDGVDVTGTVTNATLTDNTNMLNIGSDGGGNPGNFSLAEVAIYSQALTAAQVLEHYTTGSTALHL